MLEANSGCNLACLHCNRKELEAAGLRSPKNLTAEELRFILEQFKGCALDSIKFEGLSEPMLHPAFDRLAAILRGYFPEAFVIIATNLNYKLERTPFLATLPSVDMVYLSIDGVRATYEKLRCGASFEKLLSSLDAIERLVDAETRAKKLFINFTATEANYRELPEIYGLREKYGLAGVRINLAQNWNEHERNANRFSAEMLEFLKSYRSDVKGVPTWDYKDCFWPFNGMIIDVYGDVRQCVINTSMKPIGNVFRQPAREIFNSSRVLAESREALDANRAASPCRTCDYKLLGPALGEILGSSLGVRPRAKVLARPR